MSENTSFYISVFLGGILISFLGTLQTIYVQKEDFQTKGAFRDFFIGVLLVTFLYQIVPESVSDFGSFISNMKLPNITDLKGGGTGATLNPDFDLQVGVPRF